MARYRATIKGNRGEASRLGTVSSGLNATINGWNDGVEVRAHATLSDPAQDALEVYVNGGSNGHARLYVGTLRGGVWTPAAIGRKIGDPVRVTERIGAGVRVAGGGR